MVVFLKNPILTLCLIISIVSCSENQKSGKTGNIEIRESNRNFTLKKLRTITLASDSDSKHGSFTSFIAVNEKMDKIALYDHLQERIVVADSNGQNISFYGKKGRGPGEFINVTMFDFDEENRIVAYDDSRKHITIFQKDGEVFNSFKFDVKKMYFPVGRNILTHNNKIFIGVIDTKKMQKPWKSPAVTVMDYTGKLIKHIGSHDPFLRESTVYWMYPFFDINKGENNLVMVNESSFKVQEFDIETNSRMAYFGKKPQNFLITDKETHSGASREELNSISRDMSFPSGIFIHENFIYFYFINLTKKWHQEKRLNDRNHFLAIYNIESEKLLYEMPLPGALLAFKKNYFYILGNQNPNNFQIDIYKFQ